jgi:hypothetical protein
VVTVDVLAPHLNIFFSFPVGHVKVLALDVSAFNMVMGPLEDVLKRRVEGYKTFKQLLAEGAVKEG